MAATTRRDLFLQVNADVSPLTAASKAGRTALLNLGSAADDVAAEVEKAFQNLGNGKVDAAAKTIERSFESTFAAIRRNAAAVMEAPTGKAALQILDTSGSERAAAAAETQAAALRRNADAAAVVAQRAGEAGAAERVLAVAFETAAQHAEQQATAMRSQAGIMATVAAEVRAAGASEVQANEEVTASHTRMGASGMIVEHVVRSMSDSIAAGQSPIRALTMEMGRITEAMTLYANTTNTTEGAFGKFASFMGGPWGIAVSIGVAVLVPLVAQLVEAGAASEDSLQKLKDEARQTDITRAAKELFRHSVEGLTEAIHAGTDATRKSVEAEKSAAEQANLTAKANLDGAVALRSKTRAMLEAALAEEQITKERAQGPGQRGENAALGVDAASNRVAALRSQLAEAAAREAEAQARVQNTRIDLAAEAAKREANPIERIKKLYDDKAHAAEDAARKEIAAGKQVTGSLTAQLADIERQRQKAMEAEQERERKARAKPNDRQVGRQIDVSEATDIIHGIGGRVTSGTRTREQQQVLYDRYKAGDGPLAAKPGTSNHESGQALDIAMGGGMSLAKIRAAFEAQGVRITELLNEGDHFHVAWGKKGPSDETLQKRQEAQQTKAANDDRAYQTELGQAQARITRANMQLADTIEQRAISESFGIDNARQQRDIEIDDQVKAKKISVSRGIILKGLNDRAAGLEQDEVAKKLGDAQSDRALSIERSEIDGKLSMLHLQMDLADTTSERKRIAEQILAYEQREARASLQAAINKEDDPQKKAALQGQLANLPAEYAAKGQQVDRQYGGPLDNYRERLKQNVGDMNEAMSGVKADALQGVENGLTGILSGTKTVAQGFKEMADQIIADLARIAIEKLIFSVIGLKDGGAVRKLASGGPVFGEGGARDDRIPAMLSHGEYVVNAAAYSRHPALVEAINSGRLPAFADGGPVGQVYMRALPSAQALARTSSGGREMVYVQIDKSALFDVHVQRAAAPLATAAIIGGSNMAMQEISDRQSQAIPS